MGHNLIKYYIYLTFIPLKDHQNQGNIIVNWLLEKAENLDHSLILKWYLFFVHFTSLGWLTMTIPGWLKASTNKLGQSWTKTDWKGFPYTLTYSCKTDLFWTLQSQQGQHIKWLISSHFRQFIFSILSLVYLFHWSDHSVCNPIYPKADLISSVTIQYMIPA